jgi:hypothetical protein
MSSRTLKPIAVMNEIPPEPLPSFAPLTHKKPQAGRMEANGPKSKAVKSQSGRSQGVTVSTVCTSLEGCVCPSEESVFGMCAGSVDLLGYNGSMATLS